ncbi:hypothetical protein LCGC14_0390500 [marine sediment metagenome]|uniref:Uncharacterized protein n=1 Tax=marine sediment metagenome TaxID=412755 RepID=A0A0F9SZU4_9ZZZZ
MTVFADTYDKATPAGSDDPAEADDRMRETKAAVQERENVDHYWPLTGTEVSNVDSGEHRKVTLRTGSAPTAVADKGFVYAKDVSGKAELFYRDEDGDEIQITTGGILNSLNLTGVQTAAGVKTFSSIPVLPASDPTADNQASRKKFVVDQIAAGAAGSAGETEEFNAAAPTSFTDLDLPNAGGQVPAANCLVFLMISHDSGATRNAFFRKNGSAFERRVSISSGLTEGVWVETDASGIIEWYLSANNTTVITSVAFIRL